MLVIARFLLLEFRRNAVHLVEADGGMMRGVIELERETTSRLVDTSCRLYLIVNGSCLFARASAFLLASLSRLRVLAGMGIISI